MKIAETWMQIWWAAAWMGSVRAAMEVATANVPLIATERSASRPACN
jgi:hypothetical protein